MATYIELINFRADSSLRNKIQTALVIKSHSILQEPSPSAPRLTFAQETLRNPTSKLDEAMWYLLAANKDADAGTISGVSDVTIQTHVDSYVNKIAS